MKILAADTSTEINTVAVCDAGGIAAETVVDCGRAHCERLLATVDWVLGEAGIPLDDLDALAISNGPGSFTGLRVGVSAWKGLALAADKPLVAVPTLDAMARLWEFHNGTLCVMTDAKMGEVFAATYVFAQGRRDKIMGDRICKPGELLADIEGPAEGPVTFCGNGAVLYRQAISTAMPNARLVPPLHGVPRASAVAHEARLLIERGASTDAASVSPVYLRKSQAEEKVAARKTKSNTTGRTPAED